MKKFGIHLDGLEQADVAILGVLLGKAAKKSVEAMREQSWHVEFFDFDKRRNLFEGLKIADLGDMDVRRHEDITKKISEIVDKGKMPFLLGGNHQLTLFALKAFEKTPKLLIFDAHTDIYDSYMDENIADSVAGLKMTDAEKESINCATWVRRFVEMSVPTNVAYFGVRSGPEDDMGFIQKNSIAYFTPRMLREDFKAAKDFISSFTKGKDVYVTVDIDFFDPAVAPGVYHPEPGGQTFPEFQDLLASVAGKIVGADVVELKPIPENFVTEFLAVRTIYEILGKMSEQKR